MREIEENSTIEARGKTDYVWLISCALVAAVAAFLRFFWLDLKPFHHDEGVNGFFLTNLIRDGVYKYDPANYHGPTLYYISLAFAKVFGFETIPVRASVAIFGVLLVILTLFLKRYIGMAGSLFAALFLALSPGMVYISRYFIHEMFFVFLSLAIVMSVVYFIERRRAGVFAIAWMALLMFICFLPSSLNLAAFLGGDNLSLVWVLRIAFFAVEAAIVYFTIRMILAWDEGRPVYLLLASASAALLFATKETAFITLGTMLIACFSVWLWNGIANGEPFEKAKGKIIAGAHAIALIAALVYYKEMIAGGSWVYENFMGASRPHEAFVFYMVVILALAAILAWAIFLYFYRQSNETVLVEPYALTWSNFRPGLGSGADLVLMTAALATIFIYLGVLFFSSFFTYAEGVGKAFEAYAIWTKTGSKDHTQNGPLAYLKWGIKVETPILVLSALGALIALARARHRFAMFTAFWAFGLFAAYTIIPYKTPWLSISFYLPMCIIAGYGINELISAKKYALKAAGVMLVVFAASVLAYQTYDLNFVRYDDEEMGYVYAHSKREMLDLVRQIGHYAEKSCAQTGSEKECKPTDATVEIVSPDYWPMTWYLKDFAHANFHGQLVDANTAEMIVAKKNDQDTAATQRYSAHYKFAGVYPLRPGVDLMLLVRRDLADKDAQELYKIPEYVSPEMKK